MGVGQPMDILGGETQPMDVLGMSLNAQLKDIYGLGIKMYGLLGAEAEAMDYLGFCVSVNLNFFKSCSIDNGGRFSKIIFLTNSYV